MRIAHVTDGYLPRLGGIETQVHDLARAQRAEGHDVEIITSTPAASDGELTTVHRPIPRRERGSSSGPVALGTRRASSGGYDMLHVHLSIASPLAMSVLWQAAGEQRPVVATMHSMWGPAEVALVGARRVLGHRASSIVWTAVSSAAAAPLRRSLDVPVRVVPNGVDMRWWSRAGAATGAERLRVLSVMRLTRRKRPLPFLRMMNAAGELAGRDSSDSRSHRRISVTVVGDGSLAARTRRAAHHGPVEVDLAGRLSRPAIRAMMPRHDIYVAPAPLESFGLAALEARSAGLPVIGYRRSGVADFIRHGVDGVLVEDDAGLVAAVADLARHRSDLEQLRSNARNTRPPLGWAQTLEGYRSSYARACEVRGDGSHVAVPDRVAT